MSINPVIIYGFNEGNLNYMLDTDILDEYNAFSYMTFISQSYSRTEVIYGVECELKLNGKIIVDEEYKKQVEELYKIFMENKIKSINVYPSKLGYYLCVNGEIDYWYHESYSFNDYNNDDNDDD